MEQLSFRTLDNVLNSPFQQYLLPQSALPAHVSVDELTVIGAVWGKAACGAAAVLITSDTAELVSLFVDPQVRGKNIATNLLRIVFEKVHRCGLSNLSVSYVLGGEELTAMDSLIRHYGGKPEFRSHVYGINSADCHNAPIISSAFRPSYRPAPEIVSFSLLDAKQIADLDANEDIPVFLRPSACAAKMDPDLSMAWLEGKHITAYVLGGASSTDSYSNLSAWREKNASPDTFHKLLVAQLNRCFYRSGGDFHFFCSPVTPHAEKLVQALTAGKSVRYEEHFALLSTESGSV